MPIDIDRLTQEELIDLNHRVVARIRFLNELNAHRSMLEFRIGERVAFDPPGRPPVTGVLVKYNRKSVTVLSEDGGQWNVAPTLLRKVIEAKAGPASATTNSAQVLSLPRKS